MKQKHKKPFTGTWVQEADPCDATAVVYTIACPKGRYSVRGIDTSDDEELKISGVRGNGKELTFISLCPSTNWKAKHVMRLKRPGLAEHLITYTETEIWKKRSKSDMKSN